MILDGMFGAMAAQPDVFNTQFSSADFASSFFYNFVMWLGMVWLHHLARPALRGSELVKSLQSFGLALVLYASIGAVLMNHYLDHTFYRYFILDGVVVIPIVGLLNGLLYPLFVIPPPETSPS